MAQNPTSPANFLDERPAETCAQDEDEYSKTTHIMDKMDVNISSSEEDPIIINQEEGRNTSDHHSLSPERAALTRPHLNAKRRLDFHNIVEQADPVMQSSSSDNVIEPKSTTNTTSLSHDSFNFEHRLIPSRLSEHSFIDTGTNRVKTSAHIHSSSSFSPSHTKPWTSAMAVSPLTKAFKAFHVHQSQTDIDRQNSPNLSSSSQSYLLPSYSYPCLFTAHPLTKPFIDNLKPPPQGKVSKSQSISSPPPPSMSQCSESTSSITE